MNFDSLKIAIITVISQSDKTMLQKLQNICDLLHDHINHYDWVGFYFADHKTQTLHLGPFAGDKTEHTQIAFGKGICGQVALSNRNFVVQNVQSESNYIACSTRVKSEIVIPIFVNTINIGQLDIDSHQLNAFSKQDELFLEFLADQVAKLYE